MHIKRMVSRKCCKNIKNMVALHLARVFQTRRAIMQKIPIKEGWFRLWHAIGAEGLNAWNVFFNLFQRYCEPHRYYHDFSHVMQLLKEFKEVKHLCINPDAVEMFLWGHDIICDPKLTDNEERSEDFISGMLRNARVAEPFIQEVGRLILLSKQHDPRKDDIDGCLAVDLDLSIFGQPALIFNEYEQKIWKEWVLKGIKSEDDFAKGRAGILEKFLQCEFIYHTSFFREKYEQTAQKNLKRSLRALRIVPTPVVARKMMYHAINA